MAKAPLFQYHTSRAVAALRDSYLRLTVEVLRDRREPLTAPEIVAEAQARGWMPSHLYGKTQHKTLNARLSEHIREQREEALVFRVGPAKYFLSELLGDPSIPPQYKRKFRGTLRSKQVRQERVLVADSRLLRAEGIWGFVPFDNRWFSRGLRSKFQFVERRAAETRDDIKQFVSYTLVVRAQTVLCYRRGAFNNAPDSPEVLDLAGILAKLTSTYLVWIIQVSYAMSRESCTRSCSSRT